MAEEQENIEHSVTYLSDFSEQDKGSKHDTNMFQQHTWGSLAQTSRKMVGRQIQLTQRIQLTFAKVPKKFDNSEKRFTSLCQTPTDYLWYSIDN